jgi:acetyl-CoA C-acetyltransferase
MRDVAIISTARTPVGKAFRGMFNDTEAPVLAAHALREAVNRAGVDPKRIDDVFFGAGNQWGTQSYNLARLAVHAAGFPDSIAGFTIDRKCGSGLTAVSLAARSIRADEIDVAVAGGAESISLTVDPSFPQKRNRSAAVTAAKPNAYMAMIETAEVVAERYDISRERQDQYAVESHRRAARAASQGLFQQEIAPLTVEKLLLAKDGQELGREQVLAEADEGIRADTTLEALQKLKPVWKKGISVDEGRFITAGNASQLSDGASAQLLMERTMAEREGLPILGIYRGFQVAGCKPDEMGIGPVFAVPKLLDRAGLSIDDIGLWEINEAFASQVLYCRDQLGIDPERFNVNGGALAIGHPFGMTGSRLVGHALLEAKRRNVRYAVVGMCIAGGMGAAGLFEIY